MDRQRVLELPSRCKHEVQARFGMTMLASLGSTARDNATSVSDVDILVAFL
ncbi:MAG: nucleotidyltransferase domain-containing protein [Thermodesulfobacteriota bacterium]